MKKNLLIFVTFLTSILSISSFAQLTVNTFPAAKWPGVCENLELTYTLETTATANIYKMNVDIKNVGTTDIVVYCDVYASLTPDAVIAPGGNCYPELTPGSVKPISFNVDVTANPSLESFDLMFKVKNGKDDAQYCEGTNRFWLGSKLSVNEIDRSEMSFESTYYDILGRRLEVAPNTGLFLLEKTYEDGYKTVEKIYLNN